jgi:hypothetical protein
MKRLINIFYLLFSISLVACNQPAEVKTQPTKAVVDTYYTPINLEDCFKQIDKLWSDSIKNIVKAQTEEEFSSSMHMGFGLWIRNTWGLWGNSRLAKYFNSKGIFHADDMSGIILDSYHRYLTGKEIDLDKQIKFYQNAWKVTKRPSKDSLPKFAKNYDFNIHMTYDSKINGLGCVHIGTNSKTETIWLYDYHHGWTKGTKADLNKLEKNQDKMEEIIIEIFNRNKNNH